MLAAPRRHGFQTASQPFAHRADMNREIPFPASLTDMRESKKIEARRPRPTRFLGLGEGFPPKLHQPSLVRMQRQSVLRKSLFQHFEHFLGVLPILKAENEVVGKTDLVGFAFQPGLHYGLKPLIEYVMKVDISEQGTDHLPLPRSRFASDDRVEVSLNIRFQNRRDRPTTSLLASFRKPGVEERTIDLLRFILPLTTTSVLQES